MLAPPPRLWYSVRIVHRKPQAVLIPLDQWPKPEDDATFVFSECYTVTNPDKPIWPTDVMVALRVTQGVIADAATMLRRSRSAVVKVVDKYPELAELQADHQDAVIDRLKQLTIYSALAGDAADRRYLLSTLGKHHGFTTSAAVTGANGGPIEVKNALDFEKMPVEDREALLALLTKANVKGGNDDDAA